MNKKHFSSTQPRKSRSALGHPAQEQADGCGSTNVGIVEAEATASPQDRPDNAGNGDSLPSSLPLGVDNEDKMQALDQEVEATAATSALEETQVTSTTSAEQAASQGNESDAGQAKGTSDAALTVSDGLVRHPKRLAGMVWHPKGWAGSAQEWSGRTQFKTSAITTS